MLWRSSGIVGYGVRATDGTIGSIHDLLFDDTAWTLRWAVVDTGTWLPGRQVLLPPSAFGRPDPAAEEFPVGLTRERVEGSPGIEADAPVSRQFEANIYGYYGWTPHWYPDYITPIGAPAAVMPMPPLIGTPPTPPVGTEPPSGDPHLRSANEVTGYYVRATDGDIGHVEEFLVEDGGWAIRYVVVDTRNWWPGRKVLVSPRRFQSVSWDERRVHADLTRAQVEKSPEYDPTAAVDHAYEERLRAHYAW